MAGGIYGIGGGSLLGPILVGRGAPVATVAPAALASTFVTSDAATYALLSLAATGDIAPDWLLGRPAPVVSSADTSARAFSHTCPRRLSGSCSARSPPESARSTQFRFFADPRAPLRPPGAPRCCRHA
ncbi:hypothetical protein STANM309S_06451 [Streptomyces tanashiensis]